MKRKEKDFFFNKRQIYKKINCSRNANQTFYTLTCKLNLIFFSIYHQSTDRTLTKNSLNKKKGENKMLNYFFYKLLFITFIQKNQIKWQSN